MMKATMTSDALAQRGRRRYGLMKVLGLLSAVACALTVLVGCGGSSTPKEKVYVDESEIADVLANPDNYKGQYIVLTGKVFNKVGADGDATTWQAYHDPSNFSETFVFTVNGDTAITTDEYVSVDGMIDGSFKGTNALGAVISNPSVKADSVEVLSYIDAVAPAQSTTTPEGATIDQNGMTIRVDKIEFAADETRLYLTATNNSGSGFNLYTYSSKVVQNGQQFDQDMASSSSYMGDYPKLSSDIAPGASTSGIIVFPKLDPAMNLQFIIEGHSDAMNIGKYGQLTYTFDIPGQTADTKLA